MHIDIYARIVFYNICFFLLRLSTHFKNAVLSKPECVFKNGFQFHTQGAKENILKEKHFFLVKNRHIHVYLGVSMSCTVCPVNNNKVMMLIKV